MKFTFDEAELLNNFFDGNVEVAKSVFIRELEDAKSNTEEKDLIDIANSTLQKIKNFDGNTFKKVFNDFPLNDFSDY